MKPTEFVAKTIQMQDASFHAIRRIQAVLELMQAAGCLAEAPPLESRVVVEAAGLIEEELLKIKEIIKNLAHLTATKKRKLC